MERQKLIGALSETQEDQILLARVWDRISAGARRNIPTSTCFLSGREQLLAEALCRRGELPAPVLFGGYEGAERRTAVYLPDYLEPEQRHVTRGGIVSRSAADAAGRGDFNGAGVRG